MKIPLLIFTTLLFSSTWVMEVTCEGTCKEFVAMITKKQLSGITTCSKTMKFKNPKEKAAKMNCILRCVMMKEGLLEEDGSFASEEKLQEFVHAYAPQYPATIEKAEPMFRNCMQNSGDVSAPDEFCKAYDPFIKCALDVVGTLCKGL